jgi:proteasome lid subunit RPN8/RPN11
VNFSIPAIIRAFVAPKHRIRCSKALWSRIATELCRRAEGRHESGCFLLGRQDGTHRHVVEAVYYDELHPEVYASGVCILRGDSFGKLWKICRAKDLDVVADVHTHMGGAFQSEADRTNPMIAKRGHIAMIAPEMGCSATPAKLAVYEYQGGHQWIDHSSEARQFFYVGRWA